MTRFAYVRRRLVARHPRTIVLTRPNDTPPPASLTVTGGIPPIEPDQIQPPMRQGDVKAEIMDDERLAANWPDPGQGAWATIDGQVWAVLGASKIFDGAVLIGWSLWLRGGDP